MRIKRKETEINLMNIYAPNSNTERKDFFNNLWQYKTGGVNLLVAGNFNCVPDLHMDKLGGNPSTGDTGLTELHSFTYTHDLIDVWRLTHPHDKIFTWSNRDYSIRSRLDRWYIPNNLRASSNLSIRACPFSDHALVELNVMPLNGSSRGKGVWKLNNSILHDDGFKNEIKLILDYMKSKQSEYDDQFCWWDDTKKQFKRTAINYSIRQARHRGQRENSLLRQLKREKHLLNADADKAEIIQNELNAITTQRLNGAKIRSRAQWIEEGEKPTSFFFNLEQSKQANACYFKAVNY